MGRKKTDDDIQTETQVETVQTSYSEDISRIREIVDLLQHGCEVDDMLSLVKEATKLIDRCQCKLARTEMEISEALKPLENIDGSEG